MSKIVKSRDGWKGKAKKRGSRIRNLKKTVKVQGKRGVEKNKKIDYLENEVAKLRAELNARGLPAENGTVIEHRTLCVLIVICGIISFRSVPRILEIFQPFLRARVRIPHFTSVINWTLRVGVAIFKQGATIIEPWVALIDCSIDIGTRKALVVLRVPLSALENKQGAIGPQDCECIGLEVTHQWDGQLVCEALTRVFEKAGNPKAIIKDGGTDLKKGVELFCAQKPEPKIRIIDDIGHVAANALKALYAPAKSFIKFIELTSKGAARIRQTTLALLLPPKIRTKGRFQGITAVAKWAQKILDLLSSKTSPENDSDLRRTRKAFAGLAKLRPFLKRFCQTCSMVELFLGLMKTSGLNEATYAAANKILAKLSKRSLVRIRLSAWLEKHIDIQRALEIGQLPILVSSDAIESLFGAFKTIIQRSPQAELNKLVFAIPLLCGNHSYSDIDRALNKCSHSQMIAQIKHAIPPTLRQQRIQKFKNSPTLVPKSGVALALDSG